MEARHLATSTLVCPTQLQCPKTDWNYGPYKSQFQKNLDVFKAGFSKGACLCMGKGWGGTIGTSMFVGSEGEQGLGLCQ